MTEQDRKDYERYKQKVRDGHYEFVPCVEYFENGGRFQRKDCEGSYSHRLQKLLAETGLTLHQIRGMMDRSVSYSSLHRATEGNLPEGTARNVYYSLLKALREVPQIRTP